MVYNPSRSHQSSHSQRNDTDRFGPEQQQELLTPPLTPSDQKWNPQKEYPLIPASNGKSDLYLHEPTSYKSYAPEIDESYPLHNRSPTTPLQLAELNVQKKQERDTKLKKHIRRFRFIVRALNLGCRYLSGLITLFNNFSVVVISLLAANLACIVFHKYH